MRDHNPRMATTLDLRADTHAQTELWREAVTMALYVSVIEIAELAALPEEHFAHGRVTGPVGGALLLVLWGTAVGLALAHWFAFRIAAPAFRGERPTRLDTYVGLAQFTGAAFVAAVSTIPVLVLSNVRGQEFTGDVPAAIIGVIGYFLARSAGRPRIAAAFYGVTALALGVLVAAVKSIMVAH